MKLGLNPSYSGVAKILPLCAPMPKRNMETQLWRRKSSFITLPGKGGTVGWHLRNCAPLPWWVKRGDIVRQGYRLPRWFSGKESTCQCRRHRRLRFNSWVRKTPGRRKWQPIPVFLPGEPLGQRGQAGYSPWGHKESDMTERLDTSTNTSWILRQGKLCIQ